TAADTKARQFTDRPSAHRRRPHQPVTTPPTTAPASDQRARAARFLHCSSTIEPESVHDPGELSDNGLRRYRVAATPPATTESSTT
ncbi:hypothetical protein Dimus_037165, partial [Dionaea muscipula]